MKKWNVYGSVVATKYLGQYEAETAEEAERLAIQAKGSVCLCHQCAEEASDAEIDGCTVEEVK